MGVIKRQKNVSAVTAAFAESSHGQPFERRLGVRHVTDFRRLDGVPWLYWGLLVASVEDATIVDAADGEVAVGSMITLRVEVDVRPALSVAT
jgi:hypothetical protein